MTRFRIPFSLFILSTVIIAPFALADESAPARSAVAPRRVKQKQARIAPPSALLQQPSPTKFHAAPSYESVSYFRLEDYITQSDIPNYDQYYNGNGTVVAAGGTIPRSDYAIGIEGGRMEAGGCFPVDPSQPNTCLQESNSSGTLVTVFKKRERWSYRLSYIDPSNSSAAEVNIGFGTNGFGTGGDSVWEWDLGQNGHRSCFTIFDCDYYGFDLNELEGTAQYQLPSCSMKLGPGYHAYLFYQYSRYGIGDTIPPGAQEWVPNTAATSARLAQPGKILFSRDWKLGISRTAFTVSGPGVIHPEVDTGTGYPTAAPTIAPGSGTVSVYSYDCGPLANVAFTITPEFVASSGGHAHSSAPALSDVNSLASTSGMTDANGRWSTTVTAGTVGSTIKYTASAQSIAGQPFTASPLFITTGFVSLIDPGPGIPELRYTGQTTAHPNNHNGSVELHLFVRDLATLYNQQADPADQGSLGLNDMSLPLGGVFDINSDWSPPHSRHRFGSDCDIDRRVVDASGNFVLADRRLLLLIARRDLKGVGILESGGRMHVQVPEYAVADILLREAK